MNVSNLLRISLKALQSNKLRSLLTMLGIIIGVASVIAMLAIGQGSKKSIQDEVSKMGSNMLMILPGADMFREQDWQGQIPKRLFSATTKPLKNNVNTCRQFHRW